MDHYVMSKGTESFSALHLRGVILTAASEHTFYVPRTIPSHVWRGVCAQILYDSVEQGEVEKFVLRIQERVDLGRGWNLMFLGGNRVKLSDAVD
jgi:hypothetical protein